MTAVGPMTLFREARRHFPGNSPGTLAMQLRFTRAGLASRDAVRRMLAPAEGSELARIMAERPKFIGALVWPYLCASWGPEERLKRIIGHYDAIDALGAPWRFSIDERLVLAELDDIHPGMMLVVDQPEWFLREGGLTVNLFLDSFRAFSVAFSLFPEDGGLTAVIGGVQGRNREGILDTYREITKALHGLRPRDMLIEAFRMIARQMGVTRILAVSEAARHHRHAFFKGVPTSQDYDAIWEDRGSTRLNADFFELPVAPDRRDLETVKPKKRPMYRRRFEFLDALEAGIADRLPGLAPVRFADS